MNKPPETPPVALVTGAATRIGAGITKRLHAAGYNILLHYNHSHDQALALAMSLNTQRDKSVHTLRADLLHAEQVQALADNVLGHWGKVDVLINNASSFYPTPIGQATTRHWRELMASNAEAPFFLSQALAKSLRRQHGSIINLIDIYADSGLKNYSIYSMAKGALTTMTRSLAKELSPEVRVNGIAPGAILWPEAEQESKSPEQQQAVIDNIPLQRLGDIPDIASAVMFLIEKGSYITGQVIKIDGGRSLII